MEGKSGQESNFPASPRSAELGTRVASSGKSVRCCRSKFGPSARDSNSRTIFAIWHFRDLALFNLAIDRKLHGCDLVTLKVVDLLRDDRVRERASIVLSKTIKPVQFELAENTRKTVNSWIVFLEMIGCQFRFPSRFHDRPHISTRQYGRLVRD